LYFDNSTICSLASRATKIFQNLRGFHHALHLFQSWHMKDKRIKHCLSDWHAFY